jgi:hypothetical protein
MFFNFPIQSLILKITSRRDELRGEKQGKQAKQEDYNLHIRKINLKLTTQFLLLL